MSKEMFAEYDEILSIEDVMEMLVCLLTLYLIYSSSQTPFERQTALFPRQSESIPIQRS